MKDIYRPLGQKNAPKKLCIADQKNKMILATLNDLALDNSDLRIIKNYLLKYLISQHALMRKVADTIAWSGGQRTMRSPIEEKED